MVIQRIIAALLLIIFLPFSSFCFSVIILNVKNGSAAVIRLTDHSCALVDAGNRSAAPHIIKLLKDRTIDTIKLAVMTHPDMDHIGGFEPIIQSGKFVISRIVKNRDKSRDKAYKSLMLTIEKKRIPVAVLKKNRKFDNVEIKNAAAFGGDPDHRSLVVYYSDYKSIAIMGDADVKAEKSLVSMKADVLVLGSHGAAASTSEAFLDAVKPEMAVISAGRTRGGKPIEDVLQRLSKKGIMYYRTDMIGDIEVSVIDWVLRVNGEDSFIRK
jgi:competence protein ComEC